MERVSIIVPIYNVEAELPRCVRSLLCQTYTDLQIILIDDGSTDGCGALCDAYAGEDARVQVIHQTHKGVADARNVGVSAADGAYILFADSDDYIEPDAVQKLYDALIRHSADVSVCNFRYDCSALTEGKERFTDPMLIPDAVLRGKDILTDRIVHADTTGWEVLWGKLYRAPVIQKIRFPEGKINEDSFVIHQIFLQCETVACISDALYHYVIRPGSIMRAAFYIQRLDGTEALLHRADDYLRLGFPKETVALTLERSIYVLNQIYASEKHWKDRACRRRYRELLRMYRRLAPRCFSDTSVPRYLRRFLLVKFIAPHWSWLLAHRKEVK